MFSERFNGKSQILFMQWIEKFLRLFKSTERFNGKSQIELYAVSKTEVLEMDTSLIVCAMDRKISEIIQLDQQLFNLTDDEKIARSAKLIENLTLISFSISDYDDDPRPLWDFKEIQLWAWKLLREQPYCLLFLDDKSCMALSIFCLGGLKSSESNGFIPNFGSSEAGEFRSLLSSSLGRIVDRYGNHHILGSFVLSRLVLLKLYFRGPSEKQVAKPCPYCDKPLRTPNAKQCFECHRDWHDPNNVIKR